MQKKDTKNKESPKAVPEERPQEGTADASETVPINDFRLFDLSAIDSKKLDMAEAAGIPIRQIAETMNKYAQSIELRFQMITEKMPTKENVKQGMVVALEEMRKKAVQQQRQMMPQGQSGGSGLNDLLNIFAPLMRGGGETMDEEMMKLVKETMRSNIDFTNSIKNAVVSKITGKAVQEVGAI